jgi:hypothetical protein
MIEINECDVISFLIKENKFGIAHVVVTENLISTQYHLSIYDIVFDSEYEIDYEGNIILHNQPYFDFNNSKLIIDHVLITQEALENSLVNVLEKIEPNEEELDGYRIWLTLKREEAFEKGLISNVHGEDFSNNDDELSELNEDVDELDNENESIEDIKSKVVNVELWHTQLCDVPLGQRLFEWNIHYDKDEFKNSVLCGYILSKANNVEEINELVQRFIDGDYSAGHELLDYGNLAGEILGNHLKDNLSIEMSTDILQVLGDLGTDSSYQHITNFFIENYNKDSKFRIPAIKGFAYAVMITSGDNPIIKPHLGKLFTLDNEEEVSEDIKIAFDSVENYLFKQKDKETIDDKIESDVVTINPFGTLGV